MLDERTTGPANFMISDPDGNTILVEHHLSGLESERSIKRRSKTLVVSWLTGIFVVYNSQMISSILSGVCGRPVMLANVALYLISALSSPRASTATVRRRTCKRACVIQRSGSRDSAAVNDRLSRPAVGTGKHT